jgi:DNA-binding NarL/FixJ family response regulator
VSASVLLIEDEALIRMMLVELIEEAGHSVVAEAGNVTKGAALATEAEFDLAILDINLGGDTIEVRVEASLFSS